MTAFGAMLISRFPTTIPIPTKEYEAAMAEENQSGFKVTDRRMFNTDGSLRDDAVVEEEAPATPPPAPTPAPAPAPPPAPAPAAKTFSAAEITGAVSSAPPPPPTPPPVTPLPTPQTQYEESYDPAYDEAAGMGGMPEQTEFTEFLMRIASEAFIYLGLVEHPMTGRRQVDLQAAKDSIDMLVMLRGKTQGNLTPGEAQFYDDLLADLKMQFVSFRR